VTPDGRDILNGLIRFTLLESLGDKMTQRDFIGVRAPFERSE